MELPGGFAFPLPVSKANGAGEEDPESQKREGESRSNDRCDARSGDCARDQVNVEGRADREGRHTRHQQARGDLQEASRDLARLALPMEGGGRHDEDSRESHANDGREVQQLLSVRELLGESTVENGDQLKAEQCLDPGEHHAALLEEMGGGLIQRQLLGTVGLR
ncbi:MAG TPA: hypothetical protein VIW26_04695 [Gemmatimonadales bacterium]